MPDLRMLKQAWVLACPHWIFLPSHYREDGTCKCNDKSQTEMLEWGYVWDDAKRQWVSGPEEPED